MNVLPVPAAARNGSTSRPEVSRVMTAAAWLGDSRLASTKRSASSGSTLGPSVLRAAASSASSAAKVPRRGVAVGFGRLVHRPSVGKPQLGRGRHQLGSGQAHHFAAGGEGLVGQLGDKGSLSGRPCRPPRQSGSSRLMAAIRSWRVQLALACWISQIAWLMTFAGSNASATGALSLSTPALSITASQPTAHHGPGLVLPFVEQFDSRRGVIGLGLASIEVTCSEMSVST